MQQIAQFSRYPRNSLSVTGARLYRRSADEARRSIRTSSCRATKGSAGYDFLRRKSFTLVPHETILIPTGIRVMIEDGWVLSLYPRSGLGFRHRLQLDNTVRHYRQRLL